jgi:hypothetical protein
MERISGAVKVALRRPQRRGGGRRRHEQQPCQDGERQRARRETAPFARVERFQLRHVVHVAIDLRARDEPRLDHAIGEEPAEPHDQEGGCRGEEPVRERVHESRRIHDLRGGLREPLQQRVDTRRNQVGAESARDAGKRGGNPRERVTACGVEDHATERDDEDVAGVRGGVAQARDEHEHWREEPPRRDVQHRLEAGAEEPDVFGHADAEERDEHHAERREVHEHRDHVREERGQGRARQLTLHLDGLAVARIDFRERHVGQQRRHYPDQQQRPDEQQRGIGQLVAGDFDHREKAVERGPASFSHRSRLS